MLRILFLLLLAFRLEAYDYKGKVVGVTDGDTIKVLDDLKVLHKIRLYGIDAPEKKQAYGTQAKQHLSRMVFGKDVKVFIKNKDRYGREVAVIDHDEYTGNANIYMLQDGYAWAYTQYIKGEGNKLIYLEYERYARKDKAGLWADVNPTPPWEYRRRKRR